MSSDFKRLQPVHRLALMRENRSAREMAIANSRLQSEKEKLSDLMTYRGEYDQSVRKSGATGMQLRGAYAFLAQLCTAIELQEKQLRDGEESLSRETELWLALKADRKAIERLIEKRQTKTRMRLENREQDQMDERARRSYH